MLKNLGILNHMSIKISLVAFTNEELSRREAKLDISKHHITSHASYGHVFTKAKRYIIKGPSNLGESMLVLSLVHRDKHFLVERRELELLFRKRFFFIRAS